MPHKLESPYTPMPMHLLRSYPESVDGALRSIELSFDDPADYKGFYKKYRPGQFCQISVFGKGESAIGIANASWEGEFVRFTVQRMGVVTSALHQMQAGEALGIRGPLGNGFPLEEWKGKNLVFIGGGSAFSTLYATVKEITGSSLKNNFGHISVIYGTRSAGHALYKQDLAKWHANHEIELYQTVDNAEPGWPYLVGFVPDTVRAVRPSPVNTVAIVCGPPIMTKFTLPILEDLGFKPESIYTSLEKRMKCGIGKCGRCNIGPKYVCKDGPVFSLAELHQLPSEI
ncbi:MAG: FAD/NAD(P)-binding protein [Anaerolineaceae bacterium]|nr:FAD/NAD(P)-binding protein [Anaerolineaceae bacterium]